MMRAVSIVYLVFMTALLLSSDPAKLLAADGRFLRWLEPWAHLLCFFALAVLALSVRWPVPRWGVVLFLLVYGGATEFAQRFVSKRTPEWKDWLMDAGGIAAGAAVCWIVALLGGAAARRRRRRSATAPSDQWEVMQKVMSRPAAGGQSWWG